MEGNPQDMFLWNIIFNDQLRTIDQPGIAAVEFEVVGDGVIVIVQLEAQANLCHTTVRGKFVDEAFRRGYASGKSVR